MQCIVFLSITIENRKAPEVLDFRGAYFTFKFWWTRGGSNPLPFDCQSNVLPTELRAHYCDPNFIRNRRITQVEFCYEAILRPGFQPHHPAFSVSFLIVRRQIRASTAIMRRISMRTPAKRSQVEGTIANSRKPYPVMRPAELCRSHRLSMISRCRGKNTGILCALLPRRPRSR